MTSVELGNNERLTVEPKRDLLRLYPAISGARIQLQYGVATVVPSPAISVLPFAFAADLYVSRMMNQNERFVCRLTGEHLVVPTANGAPLSLTGLVSTEQLREIEDLRAGEHLRMHLVLTASTVVDGRLQQHRGDEHVAVSPGEWGTELARVEAAAFVELLVPMPTAAEFAIATRRIREARDLLRRNDVDAAMGAARLALEAVRDQLDTIKIVAAASAKSRERNQVERNAFLVEAAY